MNWSGIRVGLWIVLWIGAAAALWTEVAVTFVRRWPTRPDLDNGAGALRSRGLDVTMFAIEFDWRPAGEVGLDQHVRLVFPTLAAGPGVYRFWIDRPGDAPSVYVGEAANLRKRMTFYRSPGPQMPKNLRLRDLLTAALLQHSPVTVSIVTEVTVQFDGGTSQPLRLDRHSARLVVEQAAVSALQLASAPGPGPRILDRPGVGEQD
jgi:hypothetical protein